MIWEALGTPCLGGGRETQRKLRSVSCIWLRQVLLLEPEHHSATIMQPHGLYPKAACTNFKFKGKPTRWPPPLALLQVFMLQRKSTPDLQPLVQRHLAANPDADLPSSINFDSLKSLPTALPWARQLGEQQPAAAAAGSARQEPQQGSGSRQLEQATAELVARLLREQLHLTLFGFDIVIDHQGGGQRAAGFLAQAGCLGRQKSAEPSHGCLASGQGEVELLALAEWLG